MDEIDSKFYLRLKQVPAVLLLGQGYLTLESGTDPFLAEVLRKYGKVRPEAAQYTNILDGQAQDSPEAALAWMQERCGRLSTPEWLKTVGSFAWSAVYTSAIDSIWPKAFRAEWRELHPLFEEKYKPDDPRNRFRLHCTLLFGCVDRVDEEERPPLNKFELLKRRQVAVALARRLPEVLTFFGCLLIEGYTGQDWFSIEDLVPIIDQLNSGQAHIFSVTPQLSEDPFFADFVRRGKLILHRESLAMFLLRGKEAGFIALGFPPEEEERGRHIKIGDQSHAVPAHLWNQISRSAVILDDSILAPPAPLSVEKRYREFRNFLSASSITPLWSGYSRGFAFRREFEEKLRAEVDKKLRSKESQDEPVILSGQTGTGKTIALGALAVEIRKEGRHPVLFIERKSQRPNKSDIDTFCKWAEDFGAPTTLVIWDGMVEVDQYYDLLQYLVGRGRHVVVVGSCYRIETKKTSSSFIEAPATLSDSELSPFSEFLNNFDDALGQLLHEHIQHRDGSFLVALYRLLPATRSLIRSGVSMEVGVAEQEIQRKVREITPEPNLNTLGYALWKAGLITEDKLLSSEIQELGGEKMSELQQLTGLVMVPGRFGLQVPIELLSRSLRKSGLVNIVELLSAIDVFRWHEDMAGNISVGPRHPLEAKLVVQARLGGANTEVAFAKKMLLEVQDADGFQDSPEVQFAIDLVRGMGPNEQDASYFAPHFRELAETLGKLREERGVLNARLMLQEATLLRGSVIEHTRAGEPPVDAEKTLDRSEAILRQAIELTEGDRKNRKLRGMILVELASTLGAWTRHILQTRVRREDAIRLFQEAQKQLFKARALDQENYYPIDVLSWTTRDIIKSGILDTRSRAEVEADIRHAFDMAEGQDFGAIQQERFNQRRLEIFDLLGKTELSEQVFRDLLAQGSSAGYYLRASNLAGELAASKVPSSSQIASYRRAATYLEENRQAIAQDGRCLYLLLRLWWLIQTRRPMFYAERQVVAFGQQDWQYCQEIVFRLMAIGESYTTPSLKYISALASFHLGNIEDAFQVFKDLERESDYIQGRRRIIRSYLASNPNGTPRVFDGTVRWVNEDGTKGELYITGIRRNVTFFPPDFNRRDIRKGETLSGFHIAFNFLGPIADPPRTA